MPAPYRRARDHAWLVVVFVFLGIGVGIAGASRLPKDGPWWLYLGVCGGPVLFALLAGVVVTQRIDRNRVARIEEALLNRGYVFHAEPTPEEKSAFFEAFAELEGWAQLRNGAASITWLATLPTQRGKTCVFAHQYITGSGKTMTIHDSTLFVLVEPTGQQFGLAAHRPHFGHWRAVERMGERLTVVGDDDFNKRWIVFGDPAAADFLVPEVRALLANSPRGESLYVGPQFRSCGFKGALDVENLFRFMERSEAILRGVGMDLAPGSEF